MAFQQSHPQKQFSTDLVLCGLDYRLACQGELTEWGVAGQHHNYKYTNIQIHKYANTQIHKYTNTQILKYTNTQIHKPIKVD